MYFLKVIFEEIKQKYNHNDKIRFYEFKSDDWNVFTINLVI